LLVKKRYLFNLTLLMNRAKIPGMVKFSVSGLRGEVGPGLTTQDFAKAGNSFTRFMEAGTVLLARDARVSGEMIKGAVVSGVLSAGAGVVDAGMVTTPTAVYATKVTGVDAGLVITASHNPAEQNGLKFLEPGRFLVPARTESFIEVASGAPFHQVPALDVKEVGEFDAQSAHRDAILELFSAVSFSPSLKVGLDPVNGAAGPEAREILEALGCEVHEVNFESTGRFGRGGEPVPENLEALSAAVSDKNLDLGFAFDPDGDRLAFVDEGGRVPGEEYTLPLCCRWALEKEKTDVAVNLSTSRLIDTFASEFGISVYRTPVGEAHVVDKLINVNGGCGGEGNGGFIYPKLNATRDGLLAMTVLVQMKRAHGSLSEMVDALPVFCRTKEKLAVSWAEAIPEKVAALYPSASRSDADGLWLGEENFWMHVRPSNTEPVVRVLVEADTEEICNEISKQVRDACVA
jgi:phosphomannomutase